MSDLIPSAGAIGAAGLSIDLLRRLLGPTVDVIGAGMAEMTERAFKRVLDNAADKTDLEQEGIVPLRAIRAVWEEAPWAEEELLVEYLGGVLAASRTPHGRDDTGAVWAKRIGGLSTYALRLHFLFYSAARRALVGRAIDLSGATNIQEAIVFIPATDLWRSFELGPGESTEWIAHHSLSALRDEGLMADPWASGGPDFLAKKTKGAWIPLSGFVYSPSHRGMELFVAAHGLSGASPSKAFLDPDAELTDDFGLRIPTAYPVEDLRKVPLEDRDDFRRDLVQRIDDTA